MKKVSLQLMPVVAIVGPTGSGKTDLAVWLAKKLNGEIVSADSRQIYRGMDIGTAKLKPSPGLRQWLTDISTPNKPITLAQYQARAFKVIKDIHRRKKLPILVGGTGLYVDAVLEDWLIPKSPPQAKLRRSLEAEHARSGLAGLVKKLKKLDRQAAQKIDLKNYRRVIRAIELASQGTSIRAARKGLPKFRYIQLGLDWPRPALNARLQSRSASMVKAGLLAETSRLLKKYDLSLPAMTGIGYAEAAEHLKGNLSKPELVARITRRSFQYAKRQMTWFKRHEDIIWLKTRAEAMAAVKAWLKNS
jgi:tRNA dimethylallyltransferase